MEYLPPPEPSNVPYNSDTSSFEAPVESFQSAAESYEPTLITPGGSVFDHVPEEYRDSPEASDATATSAEDPETFEAMMAAEFKEAGEAGEPHKEPRVTSDTSRDVYKAAERLATKDGPRIPDVVAFPLDPDEPMLPPPPMYGKHLKWRPMVSDETTGEQSLGGPETEERMYIKYDLQAEDAVGQVAGVRIDHAGSDVVTWYKINRTGDDAYTMERHDHTETPEPALPADADPATVMAAFDNLTDGMAADGAMEQLARELDRAGVSEKEAQQLLGKLQTGRGLYEPW